MLQATQKSFRPLWREVLPQILILALLALLYLFSLMEIIPSPKQLNDMLVEKFRLYGIPLIAICAFLENLVGLNVYFPGAFTILTGMALTAGHPSQAVVTYLAIYLPSYAANILSFYLGRLSGHTSRCPAVQTHKIRNTMLWFFLTYWHPQLAALTAFSAGANSILTPQLFWKYSLVNSLFWSILWAVVIYRFGFAANLAENFITLFLGYVLIWMALDLFNWFKARRQSTSD